MTGPVRCHYATEPATRPHCQLAAAVRYGQTALCPSCDQQRSTLGKGEQPTRLNGPTAVDVLAWVQQARRDLQAAEDALAAAVHRSRQQGQPWSAIGAALGITRQAAQQRFPDAGTAATRQAQQGGANPSRHGGASSG